MDRKSVQSSHGKSLTKIYSTPLDPHNLYNVQTLGVAKKIGGGRVYG